MAELMCKCWDRATGILTLLYILETFEDNQIHEQFQIIAYRYFCGV